jgi:hypothetical protein
MAELAGTADAAHLGLVANAAAALATIPIQQLLARVDADIELLPIVRPGGARLDGLVARRELLAAALGLQRVARKLGLGRQEAGGG